MSGDPDERARTAGQVAYEAYCEVRMWRSFNGEPLPAWGSTHHDIAQAWERAARAVLEWKQKH